MTDKDLGLRWFLDDCEITFEQAKEFEHRGLARMVKGASGAVPEHLRRKGETMEEWIRPWGYLTSVRVDSIREDGIKEGKYRASMEAANKVSKISTESIDGGSWYKENDIKDVMIDMANYGRGLE